MIDLTKLQVWFITGSQHLYGEETLKQVAADSQHIVKALNKATKIPVEVVLNLTGCKCFKNMYWRNYLVSYIFTLEDVDKRIKNFT
jgi:hypothetical protein